MILKSNETSYVSTIFAFVNTRKTSAHEVNALVNTHLSFPKEFTETFKTALDLVLPYYEHIIFPDLKAGSTVIFAAHGHFLRALVKHLDGIDEKTILVPRWCIR